MSLSGLSEFVKITEAVVDVFLFINVGREVVFQCRDEGPLRARVRWLRGNGLPLPPGSRDVKGRLEMPDIQVRVYTLPCF
jgi:hypothetical protein